MEEYLMEIMKRASIFMILSQALIHFRPNPSYEKYLKFLAGIMTTVILIIPVMEWSRSGITKQYNACLEQYGRRLQEISSEVSSRELLEDMTPSQSYLYGIGEEIKEKLNGYFVPEGYIIEQVTVTVPEGEAAGEGGDAYSIQIQMVPDSMEVSAIKVDKIIVSDDREKTGSAEGGEGEGSAEQNEDIRDSEKSAGKVTDAREEELRETAAEVLEIDADRIEIVLRMPDSEESGERKVESNE